MKAEDLMPDLTNYRESLELKHDLEAMVNTRAWKVVAEQLYQHYQQLMAIMVAAPVATFDATLAQEYSKGQVSALLIMRDLPYRLIAYCENTVAEGLNEDSNDFTE